MAFNTAVEYKRNRAQSEAIIAQRQREYNADTLNQQQQKEAKNKMLNSTFQQGFKDTTTTKTRLNK